MVAITETRNLAMPDSPCVREFLTLCVSGFWAVPVTDPEWRQTQEIHTVALKSLARLGPWRSQVRSVLVASKQLVGSLRRGRISQISQ